MEKIYLHLDNVTVKDGNLKAIELKNSIKRATGEDLKLIKKKQNTQDAGTILEIVLTSKAILEIAKGIGVWIGKNGGVNVSYKDSAGTEIMAKNIDSKDKHWAEIFKIK